jgi:hypothetical protein
MVQGPLRPRSAFVAVLAVLVVASGRPLFAQEGDHFRVLSLSPTFETNVGWDSNVFRVDKQQNPTGDVIMTVSPALQATLRLQHLRISARGDVDLIYYREVSQFRSVDTADDAQVDVPLGRVTPYVGGNWSNARHRRNFEIDLPIRRVDWSWVAGVDVKLSGKTSIGVLRRQSREDFQGETVYLDSDLSRYLGATTIIQGLRFRYAATPLTTFGVDVEQDRSEFAFAPERNADGTRVVATATFRPLAMLSGSVQVGVRRRTFKDNGAPPFQGLVSRVDLAYTLLGRTRFAVSGERGLTYSYRPDQRDYLQTGMALTITQRVANPWDVTGSIGRYDLVYGLDGFGRSASTERVIMYRLGIGYHIKRARVGFDVGRQKRDSDFSGARSYEDTRIASSVSYGF